VSALDPHQLAVARILFSLPAAEGYALAGGSALLAAGVIDRPTRDVDAFVAARAGASPGDVHLLLTELIPRLEEEGWTVEVARSHQTFARLVTQKGSVTVDVDLAVDSPPLFPVVVIDGLPVLAAQDLAARKVLAILDRAEGRDYTDLRALADRFSRADCIVWAQQLDAGVSAAAIADAFDRLHRLRDYEIPSDDVERLRQYFSTWREELRDA
jgi:hypothetical protein